MRNVLLISEFVEDGAVHRPVHASAYAAYHEAAGELRVELTLRSAESGEDENIPVGRQPEFAPQTEVIRIKTDFAKAVDVARRVFRDWMKRFLDSEKIRV